MKYKKLLASTVAASALFLTANSHVQAAKKSEAVPIQILSINDFNGNFNRSAKDVDHANKKIGDVTSLAYNLSNEKRAFAKKYKTATNNSNSLSVQTGDVLGGSPAISGLLQDHPTINVLNAMKFQLGVIGNHELNEGLSEYKRVLNGKKPTYDTPNYELVNEYKKQIEKSNAKILAANIVSKKTGKIVSGFEPYEIKTIDGVKVGFIGVVDPYVKQLILPKSVASISITNAAQAIKKYDAVLKKKGVKAIVVLAHSGIEHKDKSMTIAKQNPNDTQFDGRLVAIIDELTKIAPNHSVDAILGGHSSTFANGVYKKIRVIESLEAGKSYSVVTGKVSRQTKDFVKVPDGIVKYNYTRTKKEINRNKVSKKVDAIVKKAASITSTVTTKKVAKMNTTTLSNSRQTSIGGSPVGNLVTDSQVYAAKLMGQSVDFAFTNSGGVRDALHATKQDGQSIVTWENAQKVQPFYNFLYTGTLTGAQIKKVLREQFTGGRGLEVAGLTYTYNDKGIVDVISNKTKQSIVDTQKYSIIINGYLLDGGDNFPTFKKTINPMAVAIDTDAFIDYLKSMKTVPSTYTARNMKVSSVAD